MLTNGMRDWCQNTSRKIGSVDNSGLIILYEKVDDKYELNYSYSNELPTDEGAIYVYIPAELLSTVTWNVNTYPEDITKMLIDILTNNIDKVTINNYEELVNNPTIDLIKQVASDGENTLVFRTIGAKLNEDATFAYNLVDVYKNYCNNLLASGQGVDAVIQKAYLTHNFEGEIIEELSEFIERMRVMNYIYGTFMVNVSMMSDTLTNAQVQSVLDNFGNSMKSLDEAESNAFTGYDNYCYVTNSLIEMTTIEFKGRTDVTLEGGCQLDGYNTTAITTTIYDDDLRENGTLVGGSKVLVMQATAQSNGSQLTYDYLYDNEAVSSEYSSDQGMIVTNFGNETQFVLEGNTTKLKFSKYCGSWFDNNSISTTLPSKASNEYVISRRGINGDVFDMSTGEYTTGNVLYAHGIYNEDHWYWAFADAEVAAFYGGKNIDETYIEETTYTKYAHTTYYANTWTNYNIIMSKPLSKFMSRGYNPLREYTNSISDLAVYDDSLYGVIGNEEAMEIVENINTKILSLGQDNNRAPWTVLGEDSSLEVEFSKLSANADKELVYTFEVDLYSGDDEVHNTDKNITFYLPVVKEGYKYANVYHEDEYLGQVEVQNGYIKVSNNEFSKYSYILTNEPEIVTPNTAVK